MGLKIRESEELIVWEAIELYSVDHPELSNEMIWNE